MIRRVWQTSLVTLVSLIVVLLAACSPQPQEQPDDPSAPTEEAASETEEEPAVPEEVEAGPRRGGIARIAIPADPTNIDPHRSTQGLEHGMVAWHIFEQLFTTAGNEIIPFLAEGYDTNEEGTVYTITIREGITFHDGSELTAEDVVASLQRWLRVGGRIAQKVAAFVEAPESGDWVEALDDYTVQVTFTQPNLVFMQGLSTIRQGAYIVPSEIAAQWGTELATDNATYIGTGPYRLAEWVPDQEIRLERFDQYVPREEEPNGYGGARIAYLDAIIFLPIPDVSVRASNLEADDIQMMLYGSVADFERLRSNPDLYFVRGAPTAYDHVYFNLRHGPFAVTGGENAMKLRQAVLAALDIEELSAATYGDPDLYRLDPGYMWQETRWWCDAGQEYYNQADPEKARQLLQEAGYQNEPIRFRTSGDLGELLTWTEVMASQLRDVGFNVEVVNMDLSAYTDSWFNEEGWELSALVASFRDDPTELPQYPLSDIFARPTVEEAPDLHEMVTELSTESDYDARLAVQCGLQRVFYEQALHVRLADIYEVRFASSELENFQATPNVFLWNVWLAEE